MASIKINNKQVEALRKKLRSLKVPIDKATATALGRDVVDEMKSLISKGISPISGGRFPGYLHQGDPKRYPATAPKEYGKKQRPVNLKLSGDFQDDLDFKLQSTKSGIATIIGYFTESEALKEQGHREGVKGQPKRPTIPTTQEGFSQRIQRIISRLYRERIRDLIKK